MPRLIYLIALPLLAGVPSNAAPPTACTTATTTCTEWVPMGGAASQALIYRTYPLGQRNEKITRAFILVHGAGRDANNYFRHAIAAAFLAGALDNAIVIAPRYGSNEGRGCQDTLAANEINWRSCSGVTWRAGDSAINNPKVTSFDVMDEILRRIARKEVFPNLRSIVVAGHSAGGQFVNRYEMANQVHDKLGVQVSYVVANPSSYAYPDSVRPRVSAFASTYPALPPGYTPPLPPTPAQPFGRFGGSDDCTTYNDWPYGFRNRTGYTARLTDDQLRKQLASRPTTYLVGELDILPLYGFDGSCPAMARGPTRLARGLAFGKLVNETLGAKHTTIVVPACGHNARCMFTSDTVLTVIFGRG